MLTHTWANGRFLTRTLLHSTFALEWLRILKNNLASRVPNNGQRQHLVPGQFAWEGATWLSICLGIRLQSHPELPPCTGNASKNLNRVYKGKIREQHQRPRAIWELPISGSSREVVSFCLPILGSHPRPTESRFLPIGLRLRWVEMSSGNPDNTLNSDNLWVSRASSLGVREKMHYKSNFQFNK